MRSHNPWLSLEVRWFLAGEAPDEIEAWFNSDERPGERVDPRDTWRRDRYLILADQIDMGIKWRDDPSVAEDPRLEFKGRIEEVGPARLGDGCDGVLERWVKWSCAAESASALQDVFRSGRDIIEVGKQRCIRHVDDHLHAELTRIDVDGERHWTLGFEAWEARPASPDAFATAVERFLEAWPGPRLTVGSSWGYPAWLLERRGRGR